jgi:hypothetical protein
MRASVGCVLLSFLLLIPTFEECLAQQYYMLDTEEAYTIGRGNLQTEIEVGVTKQSDASELISVPRIRAVYGLSDWADLELEYEYLVVRDTDFVDFAKGTSLSDFDDEGGGDLRIKLKVIPYEFNSHRLGFQFITKLPNAHQDSGLGTNETDFTFQALLSSDWGRFKTHLNAGMATLGDPARNGNQNDFFIYGLAGEYALSESLTLMGEIEGSTAADNSTQGFIENIAEASEGEARARARIALTGPIGDWRWGLSAFKGVNSHTEDWGFQTGMSRTWGAGAPTEPAAPESRRSAGSQTYYNPLKTEEAYTIEERDFRAEVAFAYVNQPDDSDLYIAPDLTVGWGIGPWADLELNLQYLKVEDTFLFDDDLAVAESDIDGDGVGDLRIKLKMSPFEFGFGLLGIQFVTKIPSAEDDDALGTDEVDFSAKVLLSTDWSDYFGDAALGRLRTHINAGLSIQGNRRKLSSQNDLFIWGIGAEYEILPALVFWGEVEGSTGGKATPNISQGDFGDEYAEARLGLTGPMPDIDALRDWKWGVSASTGLNNSSRDWTAGVGLSRTWDL